MLKKKKEKKSLGVNRDGELSDGLNGREFSIRPSPPDSRDYLFEQRVVSRSMLPDEIDLRSQLLKPRDQGKRGTCAAFTAACIKEYQERINVDFQGYMSPNSVYFYRENQESSGMYCRDVMKILNKTGISPEKFFPYSGYVEPENIPEKAEMVMSNFRIRQYARVTSIEGAKKALYKYGPLLIAFPVYANPPTIWKPKNEDDESLGGHAMTVVGYNSEGFIIRNSWGDDWNGDGYVVYPYSDWGAHWELWSCIDDVSDPIDISDDESSDKEEPKKLWQSIKLCFGFLCRRQ